MPQHNSEQSRSERLWFLEMALLNHRKYLHWKWQHKYDIEECRFYRCIALESTSLLVYEMYCRIADEEIAEETLAAGVGLC